MFIVLILTTFLFAQQNSKIVEEYYDIGSKYVDSSDYEKAKVIYNEGLEIFPNSSLLYCGLAYLYFMEEDLNAGIEYSKKAIELDQKNEKPYRYLGYIYSKKEDWNRAVFYFTKSIELIPTRADTYFKRGGAYYFLNDNDNSINDYLKAVEIDPNNDLALAMLALQLYNKEDYKRSILYANNALTINPDNSAAKKVLEVAKENGISITDSGKLNIDIEFRVSIGEKIDFYFENYPYLQAISLNTLVDNRNVKSGYLFYYVFDEDTKLLSAAVSENYTDERNNVFYSTFTEWMKKNDDLVESSNNGQKVVDNMTPISFDESVIVTQSIGLTDDKMILFIKISYK